MSEEKSGSPVRPIRLSDEEFKRLSEMSIELKITRTKTVKILLDTYEKYRNNLLESTELDIFKLKEENKIKQKLIVAKKFKIQQLQKQFLKVLQEKMELEEKISELEIRNKI